jgi:hypothetical protein
MSKRQHAQTQKTHVDQYASLARRGGAPKIAKPGADVPDRPAEAAPWADQQSRQQQSMSAHARETRTKMSVGQSNTMRLKRGNQPRHGS